MQKERNGSHATVNTLALQEMGTIMICFVKVYASEEQQKEGNGLHTWEGVQVCVSDE